MAFKVFVDPTSIMYLNGCRVDYVETLEGAVIDALEAGRDKGGRQ